MTKKYKILDIILKKNYIKIKWQDSKISKFHFLWLRDNCPKGVHPYSRMRNFNLLSVSKNIHPTKIYTENGNLIVFWSEGNHISNYSLNWLRDNCYTQINKQKYKSPYICWNKKLKDNLNLITLTHNNIINDNNELIRWLNLLYVYGIAIIKNSPIKKNQVLKY